MQVNRKTYKARDDRRCRYCEHWSADVYVTAKGVIPAPSGACLQNGIVRMPYDNHFCDFFAKIDK